MSHAEQFLIGFQKRDQNTTQLLHLFFPFSTHRLLSFSFSKNFNLDRRVLSSRHHPTKLQMIVKKCLCGLEEKSFFFSNLGRYFDILFGLCAKHKILNNEKELRDMFCSCYFFVFKSMWLSCIYTTCETTSF